MNKKYWLKFAIVFASIHTVLIILASLVEFSGSSSSEGCFGMCFGLINFPGFMFFGMLNQIGLLAGSDPQISPLAISIASIVISFALGSLIGFARQPIKMKQENDQK